MNGFYNFLVLMNKGKVVNYVILALYFCVLCVVVARAVYYCMTFYKKKRLYSVLDEYLQCVSDDIVVEKDFFAGKGLDSSCISAIIQIFFEYRFTEQHRIEEAFDRAAHQIIFQQERGLILLSRIASVSPLLGLLGTVTGLMAAFQKIALLGGSVDISLLSGGIWEAMITTATGLVTAIFSFFFYELFDWLNMCRVRDIEYTVSILSKNKNTNEARSV